MCCNAVATVEETTSKELSPANATAAGTGADDAAYPRCQEMGRELHFASIFLSRSISGILEVDDVEYLRRCFCCSSLFC